jgi:hypothetical protein
MPFVLSESLQQNQQRVDFLLSVTPAKAGVQKSRGADGFPLSRE